MTIQYQVCIFTGFLLSLFYTLSIYVYILVIHIFSTEDENPLEFSNQYLSSIHHKFNEAMIEVPTLDYYLMLHDDASGIDFLR